MSALRAALILILAGGATSALADQITCESRQQRAEACSTVAAGSSVRLVQQLSNTPCVEGSNWGTGPDRDSIWVSAGCRAVFDVQPPYDNTTDTTSDQSPEWQRGFDDGQYGTFDRRADSRDYRSGYRAGKDAPQYSAAQNPSENYRDDEPRSDERADESSRRYASADRLRAKARRACVDQASAGESFGPDEVTTNDVRWIGRGTFSVSLDTPSGSLICTVDRDGNVISMDNR
jgi:hypothetical protein